MFNPAEMAERLTSKSIMFDDPFPHLWIPEMFNPEEYTQILSAVQNFDPTGKVSYEKRPGIELYDPPDTDLFRTLKKNLNSETFSSVLFGFFGEKPFGKFDVTLNRDFFHHNYGPHLDFPPIRMSLQIYLPADHTQEHLGTVLGKKLDDEFLNTKQLKFLPNSGYAFISGPNTWHSLPIIEDTGAPRYSLLYRWKSQVATT